MERCFIIQPFDSGVFDRRFTDTFEPAIKQAGYEPYRVDRDKSVDVPIEQIQREIETSAACFAEITMDLPNVWYEVGYARAHDKPLCMVCLEPRPTKLPFDIQHRSIEFYKTDSEGDFKNIRSRIEERLRAIMAKNASRQKIIQAGTNTLQNPHALSPFEIGAISVLMSNRPIFGEGSVPTRTFLEEMRGLQFNELASSIAMENLLRRNMVEKDYYDLDGDRVYTLRLLQSGVDWVLDNVDKLSLTTKTAQQLNEDDIPF